MAKSIHPLESMSGTSNMIRIWLILSVVCTVSASSYGQYDSIKLGEDYRTYLLHLPTGYDGTEPVPLIIAMHGGFGNAYNMEKNSQLSLKADVEGFVVMYPEGVPSVPYKIRTWNAGRCCGYASRTGIDDVGFIDALLDSLISQYNIDTLRIYATGMSNGGYMSYRLACELSHRIAAIAPVAASMSTQECIPPRNVPVIDFHSYLDTNVPYFGGIGTGFSDYYNPPKDSVLNAWAALNSCFHLNDTIINNPQYTFIKWTDCDCGTEIHHYVTRDGGHSWPGGLKTASGDPPSAYIDATDLIWEFFQRFSLDCDPSTAINAYAAERVSPEIFPNPANGKITVRLPEGLRVNELSVISASGKKVYSSREQYDLDISHLESGIYHLVIKTGSSVYTGKVLKTD